MNIEQSLTLAHNCPESGYSCPGCDEQENLHYRIDRDEYACGACGLVSTVNEVVARARELKLKGETESADRIGSDTTTDVRPDSD